MPLLPLLLIPAMAVLNRFRGGGFGAHSLPGHPRFWVTPVFLCLLLMAGFNPRLAGAITAGWLAWHMLPHGHTFSLGRYFPERKISRFEQWSADLIGIDRAYFVKAALLAPVVLLGIWIGHHVVIDVAFAVALPFAFMAIRHVTMPARNDLAEMGEGALVGAWLALTLI